VTEYNGYLSPFVPLIDEYVAKGTTPREIAEALWENGIATPYGRGVDNLTKAVSRIAKRHERKSGIYKPPKVLTARWQVWTVEDQAAEIADERKEYGGEYARR
jgi:hypothetical protein